VGRLFLSRGLRVIQPFISFIRPSNCFWCFTIASFYCFSISFFFLSSSFYCLSISFCLFSTYFYFFSTSFYLLLLSSRMSNGFDSSNGFVSSKLSRCCPNGPVINLGRVSIAHWYLPPLGASTEFFLCLTGISRSVCDILFRGDEL